jgi:hypothetical protein
MVAVLAGARVRARRLALGLRQAAVARAVGVSAAYLNLIEHDRRRVGGVLLDRLAGVLGVPPAVLAEGGEAALLDALRAAAAAEEGAGAEAGRAEELLSRFPGWARLVAAQALRIERLDRAVGLLNDRLGQDPHLSAALHEVLSAVASVRSTAAILVETPDIEPEWRTRFLSNVHEDSERLAGAAEALVAYLDADGVEAGPAGDPLAEVEALMAAQGWHLAGLEAGEAGSPAAGSPAAGSSAAGALEAGIAGLASGAARALAWALVAELSAEAAAMPAAAFDAAAAECGRDPLRLAARFGVPVLAAMRRLALRPGAPEGLVLCDGAGAILFRKPVAEFPLPRGAGGGCPLWPLYAALGRPGQPVAALAELPGPLPRRHLLRGFCELRHPQGFAGPEVRRAAMLIGPVLPAGPLPAGSGPPLPVGPVCRICPRGDCPARREPSILTEAGAAGAAQRAGIGF